MKSFTVAELWLWFVLLPIIVASLFYSIKKRKLTAKRASIGFWGVRLEHWEPQERKRLNLLLVGNGIAGLVFFALEKLG